MFSVLLTGKRGRGKEPPMLKSKRKLSIGSLEHWLIGALAHWSIGSLEQAKFFAKDVTCLDSVHNIPLMSIEEDDGHKIVTPTTLLNGRSLAHNDEHGFAPTRRLKYMETLESQFWHGWTKTYLPLLMERSKWTKETKEKLKIGSVVLLMKEHQK